MAATPLERWDDVVNNMIFQTSLDGSLSGLEPILQAYRLANIVPLSVPMTQDDKNDSLKVYTGCVVSTGTNLNCYPTGLATTVCFDLNGDLIT